MVGTQSFSISPGRLRGATTEPSPCRDLPWSGCRCLIAGRALGKCRRRTYLHTRLPAGGKSLILGEEGGREAEEGEAAESSWRGREGK